MSSFLRSKLFRRRSAVESEMNEEITHHLEVRADDLQSHHAHLTREEALRQARLEFGSTEHYREECREALGYRLLDEVSADLRYAVRGLRRNPGFAFASIAVLGVAIAANIAFFTLYENFLMRPIPIPVASRNYDIVAVMAGDRRNNSWTFEEASRFQGSSAIEALYGESTFQFQLAEPVTSQAFVTSVSGDYFSHLGARPQLGRLLVTGNNTGPALNEDEANLNVVLSDAGWRRLFQANPSVIGRTLRVRSSLLTVVGVADPSFTGTHPVVPDLWIHSRHRGALRTDMQPFADRADYSAILRPGVSPERAAAELSAIAARLETRTPETRPHRVEFALRDSLVRRDPEIQIAAALIFTAFLAVLLIACANLANLHLGRAAARSHEIGIRLSLGASRRRLVRQLLTESTLLALCGAAFGLLGASAGIRSIQSYLLSAVAYSGIAVIPVEINWRIGLFAVGLGIFAGLAFGLLPALQATSRNLTVSSNRYLSSSVAGRRVRPARLRALLIVAQSTISLILLILAAVLVRNTQRLYSADPGYDVSSLIDARVEAASPTEHRLTLDRIAQLPSVAGVTLVAQLPLSGWRAATPYLIDGPNATGNSQPRTIGIAGNAVDEKFFDVLSIPLLQGRSFTRREAERDAPVAIISQATARNLWPGESSVLGKTIRRVSQREASAGTVYEIIGIAPDLISGFFFQGKDASAIYFPSSTGENVLVRSSRPGNTTAAIAAMRALTAASMDPVPLEKMATMQRFPFEAAAAIAGTLGMLALILTCIGLYGVVSFVVAQRVRDIGIQIALGAEPWRLVAGILLETSKQVLAGIAIALPACLVLSRLAASTVLRIQTYEWTAYLAAPALLISVTALFCFWPARRAALVDPMVSLRQE
ncbi:MAG: ABC transporter permease [Bryobacterales bacterium]|nr:ABC transporter permease [Bryobacterales bacterium]